MGLDAFEIDTVVEEVRLSDGYNYEKRSLHFQKQSTSENEVLLANSGSGRGDELPACGLPRCIWLAIIGRIQEGSSLLRGLSQ